MLFITIMLMDLLTGMEFDLFVPGFSEIQQQFHLTPFWVEALLSSNFIGYCLSLFLVGELSDRYGRKPIILFGLFIFIIGSLICYKPYSYEFLLIGRFLQGIGIAAPAILSFLIIADNYSLKQQHFLLAIMNGAINVATGIAPVIGSYVTLYFHWEGNFILLLILGLLVFFLTYFYTPNYKSNSNKKIVSLKSYFFIFQSKPLLFLIFTILITFTPYWIFVGISPILYIKDLKVPLNQFGFYQGILAFIFGIGSVLYGLLLKHYEFNIRSNLKLNNFILFLSLIAATYITIFDNRSPILITFAMLLFVLAQIIPSALLYPYVLNYLPDAKGRVSALMQGGKLIFTAIALQIVGYFYQGSFLYVGMVISIFIVIAIINIYWITKYYIKS